MIKLINGFEVKYNDDFDKFFQNLTDTERNQILNYELIVYICEGTEEEKLELTVKRAEARTFLKEQGL